MSYDKTPVCDFCRRVADDPREFTAVRWTAMADDTTVPAGWVCPDCRDGGRT